MVNRGSAAWIVVVVVVTMFLIGALLLTVLDPVMQALFASPSWGSTTSIGSDILTNLRNFWTYTALVLLIAYLSKTWIDTRRAG